MGGFSFLKDGWVQASKFVLVVGGLLGFIPTFVFLNNWVGFQVLFLGFQEYGVGGAFHLVPLMLYKCEGSHFCLFFCQFRYVFHYI